MSNKIDTLSAAVAASIFKNDVPTVSSMMYTPAATPEVKENKTEEVIPMGAPKPKADEAIPMGAPKPKADEAIPLGAPAPKSDEAIPLGAPSTETGDKEE